MKKILILLAIVTLAAGCNKMFDANYANDLKNKPVTVTAGANINQAKTYTTPGEQKYENGQPVTEDGLNVMTRSSYSLNADGDCVTWDEDYVEETKATTVKILRRYNFRTGKYTVTTTVSGDNATTAIRLTLTDNQNVSIKISQEGNVDKVEIVVSHKDEQGKTFEDKKIEVEMENMDITTPDPANPNAAIINGTWHVQNTLAEARSATYNTTGLDIHGIAEWAKGLELIKEEDVAATEGYNVTSVMIMDSSITINFEKAKPFATTVTSFSNFTVEDFAGSNSEVSKYFNGTGSFEFSGDLCIFTVKGSVKGESETPITITLTLTK